MDLMRPSAQRTVFAFALLSLFLMGFSAPQATDQTPPASTPKITETWTQSPSPVPAVFSCENEPTGIRSRAYVILMGLAETQPGAWKTEKTLLQKDPLAKAVWVYPQDANDHLPQISEKFLTDMDAFLRENPVDELVLFGSSAGGVTASYSVSRLNFSGPVALHTMAAPLKGYDLTGFRAQFLGDRQGYLRDIAIGFRLFDPPGPNVSVYHHKTVTDSVLLSYCGDLKAFCDVREIQNNNVAGSQEFFYPQFDHASIMSGVIQRVAKCYNPNLTLADLNFTRKAADDLSRNELPGLCAGAKQCDTFCREESYACETFCMQNEGNAFCKERFAFVYEPGYVPLSMKKPAEPPSEPTQTDEPAIEHIGLEISPYDDATGKAGDFKFTSSKVFHDRIFQDFGEYITETPDGKPKSNPQPTYLVPVGTKVRALRSGIVTDVKKLYSGDYSVMVAKDQKSPWRYETEHVVNPVVKVGDAVKAGQVLAEASPFNAENNAGLGMFEIGILKGGNPPAHVCPYQYLDEKVRNDTLEKIRTLYADWEAFKGNPGLYDESAY